MSWVMMVLASSFDSSSFCVHIHCAHMNPLLLKIKEGNINNKEKKNSCFY
jgi:hypothetical protein